MRPGVLEGKECLSMHPQAVRDVKRVCHPGARNFFHSWWGVCKHTLVCEVWTRDTYMHVYTQTSIYVYTCTHACIHCTFMQYPVLVP